MTLKPDKSNRVAWRNKTNHHNAMEQVFCEKEKIKITKDDPTATRLRKVQNYLITLCRPNEMTGVEK